MRKYVFLLSLLLLILLTSCESPTYKFQENKLERYDMMYFVKIFQKQIQLLKY